MVAPTLMLWLCAIAYGLAIGIGPGGEIAGRAELVSRMAFPFVIASWVMADARKHRRSLCYDYDSFVYFAAYIVVPVYLFQTRGVRALLPLLCFGGIWIFASLTAGVLMVIREFVLK